MRKFLLLLTFLASCAAVSPEPPTYQAAPPTRLAAMLPREPNDEPERFAVLIGGNTELRHRGNLSIAYQTLLETGYEAKNIFVLDSEGDAPWYPWAADTSEKSVRLVFRALAAVVGPEDIVFVYMTGHGESRPVSVTTEQTTVNAHLNTFKMNPVENLTRSELANLLNAIRGQEMVLLTDFCYWGVTTSINCDWLQISATQDGLESHGTSFGRGFWSAVRAGANLQQAFDYAVLVSPKDQPSLRICQPPSLKDEPQFRTE